VSRSGIIPISHSQDGAGPMCRTVRDAAILLGALTGLDPDDDATAASAGKSQVDYAQFCNPDGLKGEQISQWARIIALSYAYTNMLTEQSISAARTPEQALDELAKMSGTRFDGMLVRLLMRELKAERTSPSNIDRLQ